METPTECFQQIIGTAEAKPNTPQRRRCSGIKRNGECCGAWSVTGMDKCAGHLKLVPLDSAVGVAGRRKAAEKHRQARLSVRERAALAFGCYTRAAKYCPYKPKFNALSRLSDELMGAISSGDVA
jgi:hypothetical protein